MPVHTHHIEHTHTHTHTNTQKRTHTFTHSHTHTQTHTHAHTHTHTHTHTHRDRYRCDIKSCPWGMHRVAGCRHLRGPGRTFHDNMFERRMRGSLEHTYSTQNIVYISVLHSTLESCEKSVDRFRRYRVVESCHLNTCGRIAQSVERWSNKPLVMGSSPIVTMYLCQRRRTANCTDKH